MENPFEQILKKLVSIENQLVNLQIIKEAPEPERLMTLEEAARFLNCSKSFLYKKTSANEIPFQKFGKKIFFKKSELLDFLEDNMIQSEPVFV